MSLVIIEVCDANPACTAEICRLEKDHDGVSVMETSCLSHCELCVERPYALVNGKVVAADDTAQLIERVRERIEAELAAWNDAWEAGHDTET